ncbi:MAG: GNAT family N-acetyltransferase [Cyanobacteria bacterium P01_F01_bin.150]
MTQAPDSFNTPRLILRRHRISDAAAIFDYASDPQVVYYMDYGLRQNVEEIEDHIKHKADEWDSGNFTWVLTIKPNDRAIGTIGCYLDGHKAEFGYLLNRHYWGQGYATEAAKEIVEWVINVPEIYRIWATCDAENLASARVLEKCGLVCEGTLRCYCVRPNISPKPRDAFMYARVQAIP